MKLSPIQLRVLRYAPEGRLLYPSWRGHLGEDRENYVIAGSGDEGFPSNRDCEALRDLGLTEAKSGPYLMRKAYAAVEVTLKGAALLEEQA